MNRMTLDEFATKYKSRKYIDLYQENFGPVIAVCTSTPYAMKCPIPICDEKVWLKDFEEFVKGYLAMQKMNNQKIL